MDDRKLEIKTQLKILKPSHTVFEAIADPSEMSGYFIAKSSGRMLEGTTLTWQFPEFDARFPVRVLKVVQDEFIAFSWDDLDGQKTTVEISLKPLKSDETFVTVTEKGKDNNEEGINWLKRNTEGWANFLACMKAYLEYGVNLRKGAFDLSQMPIKSEVV